MNWQKICEVEVNRLIDLNQMKEKQFVKQLRFHDWKLRKQADGSKKLQETRSQHQEQATRLKEHRKQVLHELHTKRDCFAQKEEKT